MPSKKAQLSHDDNQPMKNSCGQRSVTLQWPAATSFPGYSLERGPWERAWIGCWPCWPIYTLGDGTHYRGGEGIFVCNSYLRFGNEFKRGILYPSKKVLFSGFIELTWEPPQNFDTGKIAWRSTLGQVACTCFLGCWPCSWDELYSLFFTVPSKTFPHSGETYHQYHKIISSLIKKKEKEKSLAKLGLFMSWIWGQKTLCL